MSFQFRAYETGDREACLAMFDANTPTWFAPDEREPYAEFLDDSPETYIVVLDEEGRIAGAGGVELETARRTAWLTWGMVDSTRHRHGIGTALLLHRLDLLRSNLKVDRVCIDTSHLVAPFYERHGFTTQRIIPDGYAKGLHRHEMELRFTA